MHYLGVRITCHALVGARCSVQKSLLFGVLGTLIAPRVIPQLCGKTLTEGSWKGDLVESLRGPSLGTRGQGLGALSHGSSTSCSPGSPVLLRFDCTGAESTAPLILTHLSAQLARALCVAPSELLLVFRAPRPRMAPRITPVRRSAELAERRSPCARGLRVGLSAGL